MKTIKFSISKWLNIQEDEFNFSRPTVKLLHFFQMKCRGCVIYGIPEAKEMAEIFQGKDFEVVGIHSVFEHHEEMMEPDLRKFLNDQNITFPIGIDRHIADHWMPETMKSLNLQGTPTTILLDKKGQIRLQSFGVVGSERLQKSIEVLLAESP